MRIDLLEHCLDVFDGEEHGYLRSQVDADLNLSELILRERVEHR